MKQTLILLFVTSMIYSAHAQTAAGNMMAGGSLNFYSNSVEGNSDTGSSGLTFSPGLGYFIKDNLAVGVSLIVGTSTNDSGASKTVNTSFGLGPFARYYKYTSNENFAFFGQAQFYFISGKSDFTPGGENKSTTISFAISPGFSYFFNDHWALDFSIAGLTIQSYDPDTSTDGDKQSNIGFGLSTFSPSLGFRYHFGK